MKAQLLTLFALFATWPAAAGEKPVTAPPVVYVQVWLGGLDTGDDSWKASDTQTGDSVLGDLGTLPFGGGAGQKLWGTGAWRIGFEGGGLGSWKSNNTKFRGVSNGGSTRVQIELDSTYFSLGVFMGGVVSVNLSRYVRLYAAGGPSLTWAWLQDDGNKNNTTTGVDFNNENDGSFVAYGRAGIEFVLDKGFTFGASVRYADDNFSFGNAGDLKLDQPLYLLTLGARLQD
jgi:hypothetical protein